ncbi:hypothetical protein BGZ63DRAFT_387418 [Mariannaea sp. PMI_226]|nr:hypothetical protein BGZ63DRAFT_387418 [Mariannaea sp. PMI_226]
MKSWKRPRFSTPLTPSSSVYYLLCLCITLIRVAWTFSSFLLHRPIWLVKSNTHIRRLKTRPLYLFGTELQLHSIV